MSNSGNSGNNKLPPPPSPLLDGNTLTRHAEFYYEDGSTVFQAGNFLFRFQASLLRADSGTEGYKFEPIMNRRLRSFSIFNEDPGSSDCNPIILPLEAIDFEALVSVVLGRDKHPVVASSFVPPLRGAINKPNVLTFHVVVGIVASYFGMKSLESWALSRVRVALESAKLASQEWPEERLRRLLEYLQTNDVPELQHEILGFMQLVLAPAAISSSNISAGDRHARLLSCARVYQNKTLATSNPTLFGFAFVALLSLGHRSSFWADHLTREDRMVLYAAHADLTRLSDHNDLKLNWIRGSIQSECAAKCSRNLVKGWEKTFAQCKLLNSDIPLEDIKTILILPQYRFAFAKVTSNQRSELKCGCAQDLLEMIDEAMRELFCGFTRKYQALARNI